MGVLKPDFDSVTKYRFVRDNFDAGIEYHLLKEMFNKEFCYTSDTEFEKYWAKYRKDLPSANKRAGLLDINLLLKRLDILYQDKNTNAQNKIKILQTMQAIIASDNSQKIDKAFVVSFSNMQLDKKVKEQKTSKRQEEDDEDDE